MSKTFDFFRLTLSRLILQKGCLGVPCDNNCPFYAPDRGILCMTRMNDGYFFKETYDQLLTIYLQLYGSTELYELLLTGGPE